jgi:formimidoylglutamate deiminase
MTPTVPGLQPAPASLLEADLTWTGERFERGVRIAIGADGRIAALHRGESLPETPRTEPPLTRLPDRALLPGFVNAHSHAFQRALRGRGESFPAGAGSFWSWREAMYELAGGLDEARFTRLYTETFREMRRAGITAVGEFHYLHHAEAERQDFRFDDAVIAAAAEAGIRLVLLEAYYETGAIGQPLTGAQRRFATPDPESYWRQMDRLAGQLHPATQSLGAVAHSIRAADPGRVAELYGEARRRGLVFHMHVEEQRREIDDSRQAYGAAPMALLAERLPSFEGITAIHCTHTDAADMERFAAAGGTVCLCPLTEANLGDGIADLPGIRAAGGRVCLGSDSNARISMLEEMRWAEYVQRLAGERRGVLRDGQGSVARPLLACATTAGADALGLPAGRIEPGSLADFVAIDLTSSTLAGWDEETLLPALILGAAEEAIAGTCVGDRWQWRLPPSR